MAESVTVRSGKGFKYVSSDILHETSYQRITVQVVHVPNKQTGKTHHIALVIKKLTKKPSQDWSEALEEKINLTSDKPESLQKFLNFIRAQADLARFRNAKVEITTSRLNDLTDDEVVFVQRVLTSFNSPEKRDLLVAAKQEDVNNLYAAVKHAKNKKATLELHGLIDGNVLESELHSWIRSNTWVFGVEYLKFLDARTIGIHSDSDFIVESLDNYADLIELKKADVRLFNYDNSHGSYYPSSELSKVIGQSIKYLKVMEDSRLLLQEEDGLDVLKPRIKIVIGRSSQFNTEERKALRLLNDSLHNIEIITYDEIRKRADRFIEHYSEAEFVN